MSGVEQKMGLLEGRWLGSQITVQITNTCKPPKCSDPCTYLPTSRPTEIHGTLWRRVQSQGSRRVGRWSSNCGNTLSETEQRKQQSAPFHNETCVGKNTTFRGLDEGLLTSGQLAGHTTATAKRTCKPERALCLPQEKSIHKFSGIYFLLLLPKSLVRIEVVPTSSRMVF